MSAEQSARFFSGFPEKTLHLASKRFASFAVISMDAPAKITDFGRKSVQKTLFHKCRRCVGICSVDIIYRGS